MSEKFKRFEAAGWSEQADGGRARGGHQIDASLLARARTLADAGGRRLLGITGPPGAGKSTLARDVVGALGAETAVLVPMDGFHLPDTELECLGRTGRKGAVDTFDADAYVALLRRLRAPDAGTVHAPEFRREIEASVADVIAVEAGVPLVVTEGNYLLVEEAPWSEVRPLLDECWYVDIADATLVERLVERHVAHGRSPEAARAWVREVDEVNATTVRSTRIRADVTIAR